MSETYVPCPLSTGLVPVPRELDALKERLAENGHDVWAEERIAQGWTWGPERDDELKKHPCLVPYHELPESEKRYDSGNAYAALAFILAMGFDIVKRVPTSGED